jgi:hypothetical protein
METTERTGTARDLMAELDRLDSAKVDAITDTRALRMLPRDVESNALEDRAMLVAADGNGGLGLRVQRGAHQQIAERTGIPWKYYERMLGGDPELLAENVNNWFHDEPQKRLVRMMGPLTDEQGRVLEAMNARFAMRAMLSDSYRPVDNGEVVRQVLPIAEANGATVESWDLTERHFHLRMVTPERDVKELAEQIKRDRPDLGAHFTGLHEIISTGIAIRNSETGHAAYSAQPMVKVLRCTNLLVVTKALRVVHVGSKQEGEDFAFQEDTRRLDDAAIILKVRDHAAAMFSDEAVESTVMAIANAQNVQIQLPPEVHTMQFVEGVGRRFELTEDENRILQDEFMHELPYSSMDRCPTRWTVSQALTATAKHVPDAERRFQLQQAGWQVLGSPVRELLKAASRN